MKHNIVLLLAGNITFSSGIFHPDLVKDTSLVIDTVLGGNH